MKKKFRIRFTTKIMLTALLFAGASAGLFYLLSDREIAVRPEQAIEATETEDPIGELRQEYEQIREDAKGSGTIQYDPRTEEWAFEEEEQEGLIVNNEREAMDLLSSMQEELGIQDAESEYTVVGSDRNSLGPIYIFQQEYQGYMVSGSQLRMTVDENNEVMGVSGSYCDVSDVDLKNLVDPLEGNRLLESYLKENYQYDSKQESYIFVGKKIYMGPEGHFVGYEYSYLDHSIILHAGTGEIYSDNSYACTIRQEITRKGQKKKRQLIADVNGTSYTLRDDEKNIVVYDGSGQELMVGPSATDSTVFHLSSPDLDVISWDESKEAAESVSAMAVDAMSSIESVYDFFLDNLQVAGTWPGHNAENPIYVFHSVSRMNGSDWDNNAFMYGKNVMAFTTRSNGKPEYSYSIDVTAHEYTHGMEHGRMQVYDFSQGAPGNWQTTIQYGIGEAVSDIFGILCGDYSNDKKLDNDYGWAMSENIRDLSSTASGRCYYDYNRFLNDGGVANAGTDSGIDCHDSSTLISRPAYLMSKGIDGTGKKKINNETLLSLWYDALTGNSGYANSFVNIRYILEDTAARYFQQGRITQKQLECVMDAFDQTGLCYLIGSTGPISGDGASRHDYGLSNNCKLQVYDINSDLYDNYNLKVYYRHDTTNPVLDVDVDTTDYQLKLDPGIYTFVFSDNADGSDLTETRRVIVNDNASSDHAVDYASTGVFFTDFGAECRQVALVLDASGSMDGTPMKETIKAAKTFVNDVMDQSPHTKVSVVAYSGGGGSTLISGSSNRKKLNKAIESIRSGGGTNMHGGMSEGYMALMNREAKTKIMVVLSDGLPNNGPQQDGSYADAVKGLARQIKNDGIIIYSMGFFHNCSDSERAEGTDLMNAIASENKDYTITSAKEVGFTFEDIADRESRGKTIIIRMECPIDVSVTYNGERLSSAGKHPNTKAAFGRLEINEEKESKTLYLDPANDYEIVITGNGSGYMDYTISWPGKNGEYEESREFLNVPISKDTVITTYTYSAEAAEEPEDIAVSMKLDSDGDGAFEKEMMSGATAAVTGASARPPYMLFLLCGLAGLTGLYLLFELIFMIRTGIASCHCANCGMRLKRVRFCSNCGTENTEKSFFAGILHYYTRQSKAWIVIKLMVILLSGAVIFGSSMMLGSKAYGVCRELRQGNMQTAEIIYKKGVKGDKLEQLELKTLRWYLTYDLDRKMQTGEIAENTAERYESFFDAMQ